MRKPTDRTCKKEGCNNTFIVDHGSGRKFCDEHRRFKKEYKSYNHIDMNYLSREDALQYQQAKKQQELIRVWA